MPKVNTRLLGEIWIYPSSRKVSVYFKYVELVPVYRRYWKKREDGIRQRYILRTRALKRGSIRSGRYEFYGRKKDIMKAVALAHEIMPKGHITVSAKKFLRNPYKYGVDDFWIDKEIESI